MKRYSTKGNERITQLIKDILDNEHKQAVTSDINEKIKLQSEHEELKREIVEIKLKQYEEDR